MNVKLIVGLSLFGIVMGVVSLFGLTRNIEPVLWLVIFLLYAVIIARNISSKRFLHAFLVGLLNGVWLALIHSAFFSTYIGNNPEMMAAYEKMPKFAGPQ